MSTNDEAQLKQLGCVQFVVDEDERLNMLGQSFRLKWTRMTNNYDECMGLKCSADLLGACARMAVARARADVSVGCGSRRR